jgi:CMP-N-acetylneuraminic acid synthetase
MSILTVIPARGGSKGIPQKNIYPLNRKPLLVYTIDALRSCHSEMFITVSTDNEEIASIAKKEGIYIISRPDEFSSDTASTESVLLHALDYMKLKEKIEFEYVLTAQPTSPFRKTETIDNFINEFMSVKNTYNAQLTLHEDYSDFWIKTKKHKFERLYPDAPRRRQDRSPLYVENSCLYLTDTNILKQTKSILGSKCNGFVIHGNEILDINEMKDIEIAEIIMKTNDLYNR